MMGGIGGKMEPIIDKFLVAGRRLLGVRAAIWLTVVAVTGFVFGWAIRNGASQEILDGLILLWTFLVAAAALNMRAADLRAERRRQERLDALYGRGSPP
jgi:uncharacterized membrane protein YfcA